MCGPTLAITKQSDETGIKYNPEICSNCIKKHEGIIYNNENIYIQPIDSLENNTQIVVGTGRSRSKKGGKVIKCNSSDTLFDIKVKICGKLAISPTEQTLLLESGRELVDNGALLCNLGVVPGTVLLLLYNTVPDESENSIYAGSTEVGFKGTALQST